jgi:cytochrome c oxidase subunit 4
MPTYSPKLYWKTFAALTVLLAITWSVGCADFGPFNLSFALGIAIAKAILIMLFFVHIRGSSRLLHFAAAAGVLWLLILPSLVLGDYMTR